MTEKDLATGLLDKPRFGREKPRSMSSVVVIGLGEIGTLFASGLARLGHTVVSVARGDSMAEVARQQPEPALVLISVGEWDLDSVLSELPQAWRSQVALVQNELVPARWQAHGLTPTVCIVWFEKRRDVPPKELLPCLTYGKNALLLSRMLEGLGVGCEVIGDEPRLLFELAKKSLYILTLNLAGLRTRGTAANLWYAHPELARALAQEIVQLQSALIGQPLPLGDLLRELRAAIDADPEHGCVGRSATQRLSRALDHAQEFGLVLPTLQALGKEFLNGREPGK